MASRFLESLWYVRLCHRYNVVPSSLQPLGGGCYDPDLQVRAQKLRKAEGLALGQVGGGGGGPHVAPSVYIMQAQLPPSLSPQLGEGMVSPGSVSAGQENPRSERPKLLAAERKREEAKASPWELPQPRVGAASHRPALGSTGGYRRPSCSARGLLTWAPCTGLGTVLSEPLDVLVQLCSHGCMYTSHQVGS